MINIEEIKIGDSLMCTLNIEDEYEHYKHKKFIGVVTDIKKRLYSEDEGFTVDEILDNVNFGN